MWVTRNIDFYDPLFRSLRLRDSLLGSSSPSPASFKCWDERCIHYIYGFHSQEDRDRHVKDHAIPTKKDSELSLGNTPSTAFPDSASTRGNFSFEFTSKNPSSSPLYLPKPASAVPFPPLTAQSQPKERRDAALGYPFSRDHTGPAAQSVKPEVDSQLPPIKKARVGPSRLESISELKLARDIAPCLRCRVTNQTVR